MSERVSDDDLRPTCIECRHLFCRAAAELRARRAQAFRKLYPSKDAAVAEDRSYRLGFEDAWHGINGPESWKANPWVWVVSFKRIEAQERAA